MVSDGELCSVLRGEVDTGFESSPAAGVESGKIRSEDAARVLGGAEGLAAGEFSTSFAGSVSALRSAPFRFGRYCPNCKRCQAVYAATAISTSIAKVLNFLRPPPDVWPYENVGTGTEAASNVSLAPESAVIASCDANGGALLSSSTGFSSAGATAAPACDAVLAAIGSALLFNVGAQACSTWVAFAPVRFSMDSSKATSAGSGAGVGSCSTSRLENGALVATVAGCASREAGIAGAAKIGVVEIGGCAVMTGLAGGADAFASFLRSSPRATRRVPFDCSMLMGLVNTRFAPIRNAFATPACPSTTATESEL